MLNRSLLRLLCRHLRWVTSTAVTLFCVTIVLASKPAFASSYGRYGDTLFEAILTGGGVLIFMTVVFFCLNRVPEILNKVLSLFSGSQSSSTNQTAATYYRAADQELNRPKSLSNQQKQAVKSIAKRLETGDHGVIYSGGYSELELGLGLLLVKEKQLQRISKGIMLEPAVNQLGAQQEQSQTISVLTSTYSSLSGAEHELMPLFFSPSMKAESSVYLTNEAARDKALSEFKALIAQDGLNIQQLKYKFLAENEYWDWLPLSVKL